MRPSRIGKTSAGGVVATQTTAIAKPREVEGVANTAPNRLFETQTSRLSERPRLIVELMDSQRAFSRKEVALSNLIQIHQNVIGMHRLISNSADISNVGVEIIRLQLKLKRLYEAELYGAKILNADLRYSEAGNGFVYFHVPGFNIERERDNDEVVSMFLGNRLFSIPFIARLGIFEQRKEVVGVFGRQLYDVELLAGGDIVIGMPDNEWRAWDKKAIVSGQGYKYGMGNPVAMPVTSSEASLHTILVETDIAALSQMIKRILPVIESRVSVLKGLVKEASEDISFLAKLAAGQPPQMTKSFESQFVTNPRQALTMCNFAFTGPTRANVIKLVYGGEDE
ncbi:hypothetical protein [Vibrio mediterranei]|uniref:hypothetical protein n=1 Tax=Vibrio mediterranei TaxID=689 RepID=UPI00406879A4